ncbi:MAG: hypothetical protein RBU37_12765 [Myxococcota bacterium]|jgi:hypothetical protein|nr:hypothetical protein [Myxococcota bacterium]
MGDDELMMLFVSAVLAAMGWGGWLQQLGKATRLGRPAGQLATLRFFPLLVLFGLVLLLKLWSASDVRDSWVYLPTYVVFGMAWAYVGRAAFCLFGLRWREDALESRNWGGIVAFCGALVGIVACYAGANVGEGPSWLVVVLAGGLASLSWLAVAWLTQLFGGWAERVSVERDLGAGIRMGAFLAASGLICGYGAAGDYSSAWQTVVEFGVAWVILPFGFFAVVVEKLLAGQRSMRGRRGLAPALLLAFLYLAGALGYLYVAPPIPRAELAMRPSSESN